MAAAPVLKPEVPPASPPPHRRERHLRLVPHLPHTVDTSREVREARWMTALIAVMTAAFAGLWTAAMFGAAGTAWWPVLLAVVLVGVVGLAALVVRHAR